MSSDQPDRPQMYSRPSIELLGSSVDTGILGREVGDDTSSVKDGGGGEDSLETLISRLNIEKRIQYGAEKFLEALDSENGSIPLDSRPALRKKVGEELEAVNGKIKDIQSRIDRIGGTPQKPRRRAQPMLNGFASSLSLASSFNTSTASPNSSSTAPRPRPSPEISQTNIPTTSSRDEFPGVRRLPSNSTIASSTSNNVRARSKSVGEDVFGEQWGGMPEERDDWNGSQMSEIGPLYDQEEEVEEPDGADALILVNEGLEQIRQKQEEGEGSMGSSASRVVGLIGDIVKVLKKSARTKYELDLQLVIDRTLICLTEVHHSSDRAATYRLFRHILIDKSSWERMATAGVEWLIIRSLTRDEHHADEKEQVIKLIRAIMVLPQKITRNRQGSQARSASGVQERDEERQESREGATLSEPIIRSLVSIAENPEDSLRIVTLETLAELAILDIGCLVDADAFRVLLQALNDGPYELGAALTSVLVYILALPETRECLPSESGIEIVMSGFTEAYGHGASHLQRLRACSRNTSIVLKSWSGLMYCCMHDNRGIRSLVECLRVPVTEMREVLLDMLFDVFRVKTPAWYQPFLEDKQSKPKLKHQHSMHPGDVPEEEEEEEEERLNIVDHYLALLLALFIECGIIESLVNLVEENEGPLMRKGTLLIGEILRMSNRLLPLRYAARIQALPRLFELASAFDNMGDRTSALAALSQIDNFNRNKVRLQPPRALEFRKRSNSLQDPLQRGQRQVEQVRIRMGMQVDDRQFSTMLVESGLLYGKDHTKWNYEILMEIVEGPLLNPKRLEEATRVSKFGRRLLSFFHPFNRRFSDIKRTRPNQKWARLGIALITTLLSTADGIRFLAEDKLLSQLVECFSELDQYAGQPSTQPFFSKSRMENTLSASYFDMLGILSKQVEGIKLLETFRFFTCFYHLSELRSRDDLIRRIIEHFDYNIDGHSRIILSKALTSSYMHTRIFATQHLGKLIQTEQPSEWALQLLITQLYDPSMEVCEAAVHFLESACESLDTLEFVVKMRPTLEHLGEIGAPLLLRFLSTAVGFSYLRQADYIDREMDEWFHDRNLQYVIQIEVFLSRVFGATEDDIDDVFFDGTAPPHFYGEITKTEDGCKVLSNKGHFPEFAQFIRQHRDECSDPELMAKLKSVLWAVGNIGSTAGGLPFLEEEDIIEIIVDIAEQSAALTIRGTCFFVLGLISSTVQGADILEEYGWIPTTTPIGFMTGLCIPEDLGKFAYIDAWQSRPSATPPPTPPLPELERKILADISDLGNYVLATQAMRSLARARHRHRPLFSSPRLYLRALLLLSSGHYKQPVRAFILDMFDLRLTPPVLTSLRAEADILSTYAALPHPVEERKPEKIAGGRRGKRMNLPLASGGAGEDGVVINSVPSEDGGWVEGDGKRVVGRGKEVVVGFKVVELGDL